MFRVFVWLFVSFSFRVDLLFFKFDFLFVCWLMCFKRLLVCCILLLNVLLLFWIIGFIGEVFVDVGRKVVCDVDCDVGSFFLFIVMRGWWFLCVFVSFCFSFRVIFFVWDVVVFVLWMVFFVVVFVCLIIACVFCNVV